LEFANPKGKIANEFCTSKALVTQAEKSSVKCSIFFLKNVKVCQENSAFIERLPGPSKAEDPEVILFGNHAMGL